VTGYELDDQDVVRLQVGDGNFSLLYCIQTGSKAHPDSYPMDNRGSFPKDKVVMA